MERGRSSKSQPKNKRGVSKSVAEEGKSSNGGSRRDRDPDHYMPIASLTRIMRRVLPDHAKVADDAKEAMQECVAEFIALLTREANRRCHGEYRRTITPEDAVSAMAALGFHDYVGPLTVFINKYRAQQEHQYNAPRHSAAATVQQQPLPPMPPMTPPTSPTMVLELPPRMLPMTPPPSPAVVGGYVPYPAEDDGVEMPVVRDYFAEYRGDVDFDPFE